MTQKSKKDRAILTLIALSISAFGIGSTEFISVGLLPLIKSAFAVSLNQAGLTVSIYALGVTIGAPLMTALTSHLNKKTILLLVMTIFIIGNLVASIAPLFSILLFGRLIASFAHGVFMSVASVIAAEVVAPNKRASAIAFMFTGLTLATVTGVPLGTFIGQITNWRMSFVFIVGIGIIGLIANYFLVPKDLSKSKRISLKDIGQVLSSGQMLIILLVTAIGYGGTFVVYTYITAILEDYLHFSPHTIVILLVIYGLFVAIGNTIGGKLANKNPLKTVFVSFICLSISLFFVYIFIFNQWLEVIAILTMGLFMFMSVPGLQLYAVQIAERYLPHTTLMASALNISAFNIGIFVGSLFGGEIVHFQGLNYTPIYGSLMVMLAIFVIGTWIARKK